RSETADHTAFQYSTTFTVDTTFGNTTVARRFSPQGFNTDSLNVGQRVRIFGSLTGTVMNATAGVVIAQQTQMFGSADGAIASSTLTMNLAQVDFRTENLFDWADSGTTPPTPASFTANVGTLGDGLSIASGTPVETDGFPASIANGNQDMTTVNVLTDLATTP